MVKSNYAPLIRKQELIQTLYLLFGLSLEAIAEKCTSNGSNLNIQIENVWSGAKILFYVRSNQEQEVENLSSF